MSIPVAEQSVIATFDNHTFVTVGSQPAPAVAADARNLCRTDVTSNNPALILCCACILRKRNAKQCRVALY